MRRRTAQLNAISRSYTAKRQKEALETLKLCYNIQDWDHFKRLTGYRSSPVSFLNSLLEKNKKTLERLRAYQFVNGGSEL